MKPTLILYTSLELYLQWKAAWHVALEQPSRKDDCRHMGWADGCESTYWFVFFHGPSEMGSFPQNDQLVGDFFGLSKKDASSFGIDVFPKRGCKKRTWKLPAKKIWIGREQATMATSSLSTYLPEQHFVLGGTFSLYVSGAQGAPPGRRGAKRAKPLSFTDMTLIDLSKLLRQEVSGSQSSNAGSRTFTGWRLLHEEGAERSLDYTGWLPGCCSETPPFGGASKSMAFCLFQESQTSCLGVYGG